MSTCRLCEDQVIGRGFCRKHYYKMRKNGTLKSFPIVEKTIKDRILEKFTIGENGCWNWTGLKNNSGYGVIWKNKKQARAHRESYRLFFGDFSSDIVICHKCDNPSCINPEHLFAGNRLKNNQDSVEKGRNAFGKKNGHCRLTKDQIESIKQDKRPQNQIAVDYGINQSHVSRVKNCKVRSKG